MARCMQGKLGRATLSNCRSHMRTTARWGASTLISGAGAFSMLAKQLTHRTALDPPRAALGGNAMFLFCCRPQKFLGCAHFTLRCKRRLADGSFQLPLVALVFNFGSELLDLSEAETFFHEFGHALHSLLSRTEFQHLSGRAASTPGTLRML